MRIKFFLDSDNAIECQWATFSGRERYLHNGVELLSLRSFQPKGTHEVSVSVDGETKNIGNSPLLEPIGKALETLSKHSQALGLRPKVKRSKS